MLSLFRIRQQYHHLILTLPILGFEYDSNPTEAELAGADKAQGYEMVPVEWQTLYRGSALCLSYKLTPYASLWL